MKELRAYNFPQPVGLVAGVSRHPGASPPVHPVSPTAPEEGGLASRALPPTTVTVCCVPRFHSPPPRWSCCRVPAFFGAGLPGGALLRGGLSWQGPSSRWSSSWRPSSSNWWRPAPSAFFFLRRFPSLPRAPSTPPPPRGAERQERPRAYLHLQLLRGGSLREAAFTGGHPSHRDEAFRQATFSGSLRGPDASPISRSTARPWGFSRSAQRLLQGHLEEVFFVAEIRSSGPFPHRDRIGPMRG